MGALIIGGGIGGPVAAVALQRAGIKSVVYEAHQGPVESLGLFLGIGINGMRGLRELDLLEPLRSADTIPTPLMEFSSTTGKSLAVLSNGWLDEATPSMTLMRGALQRVLAETAQARGIQIRYGMRFVGYDLVGERVIAQFADGSEVEGDLLLGADGIHSRVRGVLSPDTPAPSYTGLLNLGGAVGQSGMSPTPDMMHMVWGRRAFFGYTVKADGEAWWFANVGRQAEPEREELAAVSADDWRRELRNLFADDPSFIMQLIDATPEIGATPIHDLPTVQTWQRDRVVLLGDAAHAVSPSAGQGASMAIEDAIVLGKCLRDITQRQEALARYEALRRPRAEKIVATGRKRGNYKALNSRTAIWLRDQIMPLVFRHFATDAKMSWIYDHHIPWDEPVLPAGS